MRLHHSALKNGETLNSAMKYVVTNMYEDKIEEISFFKFALFYLVN